VSDQGEAQHLELLRHLRADRWFAHRYLFERRHPDESAPAHHELVDAINRPVARLSIEGFRRFGKTTYLEETVILKAIFRECHNFVIVSATLPLAVQRVGAIRNEIEVNPYFAFDKDAPAKSLFGKLKGDDVWQDGRIVLANAVCIQALGREQAITGMKFRQWRPDGFWIDDIEDPQEVRSDVEREGTWRWIKQTFLPSLDDALTTWGRFTGTRRGKNSLPERLEADGMPVVKFPIESIGPARERVATWPAYRPLAKIDALLNDYRGNMDIYMQEFMCQAVSASARRFDRSMFRYETRERTWEAVYAFVDPARTEHGRAASTGWAVWSWVRNRLIVWASGAEFIAPDEIVALIFDIAERFDPVWVMAEVDGLVQWLMQPIRQEQIRRGLTIPVKGVPAVSGTRGGGQVRFIEGLQPLFSNHEVIFVQPMKALEDQLLSFPHGIRDTANALAYAQTTKPAALIYDGFSEDHIVEGLQPAYGAKLSLAANATGANTAAVLVQHAEGVLRILADWVFEGPPAERVEDIAIAATLAADAARFHPVGPERSWKAALEVPAPDRLRMRRESPGWVVPPRHSDSYTNVGLMQAVRHLPAEVRVGGTETAGTIWLRDAFGRSVRGLPAVEISANARWTLRALAGGYSRAMVRGRLQDQAEEGPYRVLMEGLESFCGLISTRREVEEDDDSGQLQRVDERTGVRYASAMPQRRAER
jgi:hypothetical protein